MLSQFALSSWNSLLSFIRLLFLCCCLILWRWDNLVNCSMHRICIPLEYPFATQFFRAKKMFFGWRMWEKTALTQIFYILFIECRFSFVIIFQSKIAWYLCVSPPYAIQRRWWCSDIVCFHCSVFMYRYFFLFFHFALICASIVVDGSKEAVCTIFLPLFTALQHAPLCWILCRFCSAMCLLPMMMLMLMVGECWFICGVFFLRSCYFCAHLISVLSEFMFGLFISTLFLSLYLYCSNILLLFVFVFRVYLFNWSLKHALQPNCTS